MSLNDEPERLAEILRDRMPNGTRVYTDVRGLNVPGLLIEPAPRRDYQTDAAYGGFLVTWRLYCLAVPPGDRAAALVLNDLADQAVEALDDQLIPIRAEPLGYQPDPQGPAYPAILITLEGRQAWQ